MNILEMAFNLVSQIWVCSVSLLHILFQFFGSFDVVFTTMYVFCIAKESFYVIYSEAGFSSLALVFLFS